MARKTLEFILSDADAGIINNYPNVSVCACGVIVCVHDIYLILKLLNMVVLSLLALRKRSV